MFGGWKEVSVNGIPSFAEERLNSKKQAWEKKHKFNAYDKTFYSKGNHYLYKLWCEATQQGEYTQHYYKKKRK